MFEPIFFYLLEDCALVSVPIIDYAGCSSIPSLVATCMGQVSFDASRSNPYFSREISYRPSTMLYDSYDDSHILPMRSRLLTPSPLH